MALSSSPGSPSTSNRHGARDAARSCGLLGLVGLVAGLCIGLLWSVVTPPVRYVVRADGAYSDGPSNGWFAADGWFLVLGVLSGAVLAGVAWWRVRSHPVTATLGVTAAGLVLAAVAWWLGGIVGPPDPTGLIDAAQVGTTFDAPLGLRAVGVLLAPAIAGLAGFLLLLGTVSPRPEATAS